MFPVTHKQSPVCSSHAQPFMDDDSFIGGVNLIRREQVDTVVMPDNQ